MPDRDPVGASLEDDLVIADDFSLAKALDGDVSGPGGRDRAFEAGAMAGSPARAES